MYPPLTPGTVLQSKYQIVRSLGQGGFGRTYLAEDQGRFKEYCAVKELLPQHGEDSFSNKAIELFRREAEILYQIQHPQIPQFRETFEVDRRLFLVQDYVEGPSYRDLLNQRRSQNTAFSESEIRLFLRQMLPVLAHIHAKGIIHRDLSPDNILLRNRDRLPVLIDFGVVKEVVTRVQMANMSYEATTVGKPGYAPSEQMQSGRAYPSSDLYSLAVTAIVLLTGREPQDLFNDVNLTWHWQQYANVSAGLAQVLNKATSYRPGDRYQSVSEMAQALGAAGNLASPVMPYAAEPQPSAAPFSTQQPFPQTAAPTPPASQMRTVAVGRAPQATTMVGANAPRTSRLPMPSVLEDDGGSIWENPFAIGALALLLAIVAGIGGWGIVNAFNRSPEEQTSEVPTIQIDPEVPQVEPDPTPTPAPTPDPEPPEAEPVEYNQPISLQSGESTTVQGSLKGNETVNYQLEARQGETLTAQLEGEGVLMTILTPNGNPPDARSRQILGWTGPVEFTGEYTIQLSPVDGVEQSNYSLQVSLSESESEDTSEDAQPPDDTQPSEPDDSEPPTNPEPPEEEAVEPTIISEQRVSFPQGQTSILVANASGPGRIRRYVVNLQEGQTLQVRVANETAPTTFDVLLPSGGSLANSARQFEQRVAIGGDYVVDVTSSESAEFTLRIGAQ